MPLFGSCLACGLVLAASRLAGELALTRSHRLVRGLCPCPRRGARARLSPRPRGPLAMHDPRKRTRRNRPGTVSVGLSVIL